MLQLQAGSQHGGAGAAVLPAGRARPGTRPPPPAAPPHGQARGQHPRGRGSRQGDAVRPRQVRPVFRWWADKY